MRRIHAGGSSLAGLTIRADGGDAEIDDASVWVRAEKADHGRERTYVVTATAADVAGNTSESTGECVVPHSRGGY
jgi:hypothetical protein